MKRSVRRALRKRDNVADPVTYSAADPMNLVGIVIPGERKSAIPGRCVTYPAANVESGKETEATAPISPEVLPFSPALEGGALA